MVISTGAFSAAPAPAEPSSAGVSLYREAAKLGGLREKTKSNVKRKEAAEKTVADALAPLLEQQGQVPIVVTPPNGCDLNDWAQSEVGWAEQLSQVLTDPALAIETPGKGAISNEIVL